MCGRLSQYRGIHDFVAALSMPDAQVNNTGDQPSERYNAAPTTQLALFHLEENVLHAEMVRWGWRPHWAKDRAAQINARVEKVAHGPFFRAIWPHRAVIAIDNWFECVEEGGPKKQPYLIRRKDRSPSSHAKGACRTDGDAPGRADPRVRMVQGGPGDRLRNQGQDFIEPVEPVGLF
jgi:putative SOS response-associated peptidase YedK